MHKNKDSNNNRIRILIDRSVEVRNNKFNLSPQQSNNMISPKMQHKLKLPSIKQSRSPSATRQHNAAQKQQTTELLKKLSSNSVKQKHLRLSTDNRRKSSLSQNKLEPQAKINSKRTRSISNMISKNSLIVSTQYDEEEDLTKKLHTNLPQNKIKIEIVNQYRDNFHQESKSRYAQSNKHYSENHKSTENQEINSLRQSLFSIIENSRIQRHNFHQVGNTDQQLQLLQQLYQQNEKLVRNYVQIRQEALQLDMRVKSLSYQRKQFRIQ